MCRVFVYLNSFLKPNLLLLEFTFPLRFISAVNQSNLSRLNNKFAISVQIQRNFSMIFVGSHENQVGKIFNYDSFVCIPFPSPHKANIYVQQSTQIIRLLQSKL